MPSPRQTAQSGATAATNTKAVTFAGATLNGSYLFGRFGAFPGTLTAATTVTVTHTGSEGPQTLQFRASSGGGSLFGTFYIPNIVGQGSHTVTVTLSGGLTGFIDLGVDEVQGIAATGALDQNVAIATANSAAPATNTTGTLGQPDEFCFASFYNENTGTTFTATAPYTADPTVTSTNGETLAGSFFTTSATTAQSAAGTWGAAGTWYAHLATFRLASAGIPVAWLAA